MDDCHKAQTQPKFRRVLGMEAGQRMKRVRIVGVVLLLWNLAGLAAFGMQLRSDPATLGDPVTAQAFATMPAWAWLAYAVATVSGTAGSLALLMRRKVAAPLFALSLIGVVAQFSWSIFGFGIVAAKGMSVLAFPAAIAVIALFGALYARACARADTLR